KHDLADAQGAMTAHEGQKDRHQIDHAEEGNAERETQDAAGCEIPLSQESDIDDRVVALERAADDKARKDKGCGKKPEPRARGPAVIGRLLEGDLEEGESKSERDQRQPIQPLKP